MHRFCRLGRVFLGPFVFFLLASGCWAAPAQVLMIRHAEKPDSGDHLSPQGYQRAQAYVHYFESAPAVTRYGTPVAIYAMGQASANTSLRAIETVTPLANALGLTLHEAYTKKEVEGLVNEIMSTPAYDGKMVLICWEHKVLSEIAGQFGVSPVPDSYPGSDFNWVWEIDFAGGQVSNFKEFRADILPSDHPGAALTNR